MASSTTCKRPKHRPRSTSRRTPSTSLCSLTKLPQNLAQHAEEDGRIARVQFQAADQAPHFVFGRRRGNRVSVAAPRENIQQQLCGLFVVTGGGGLARARRRF